MIEYPQIVVPPGGVAPSPRRVRGLLGDRYVVDTTSALYVWEIPPFPQYYLPLEDIATDVLVDEGRSESSPYGTAAVHGLQVGSLTRAGAVRVHGPDAGPVRNTARIDWNALDAWFEEDERVFVHPRNPYARSDAVRSSRAVRVELDGVVLADAGSCVIVFETGLPPRYYLSRTDVRFEHLVESDTVTSCPYKGTTAQYWSVRVGAQVHPDLAWAYDFPTAPVLAIAGLVAFFNEKLDIFLDGELLDRPHTPFS